MPSRNTAQRQATETSRRHGGGWWRAWGEILYPRRCLHTGDPLEDDAPLPHLSQRAWETALFPITEPYCHSCGCPFHPARATDLACPNCTALAASGPIPHGRRGFSLIHLQDAGRDFVHELKYRRGSHLRADLAILFQRLPALSNFVSASVLVPVPLHPSRKRWRGFNQSELIAEVLAEASQGCQVKCLLTRSRSTKTQARLSRSARIRNVRGAFHLAEQAAILPSQRYVIVDDVATTGTTLHACAAVLHEAGATRVDFATLAHG